MGNEGAKAQGTVGQALKALRETQNLTLADIASRLRLDPRVIAAIESGDHGSLPSPLYVRGYVRGYARLLGAEPNRLVELYNEESPSEPPEIQPEMSRPVQRSSGDAPVRITSMAIIIVLAVLLIAWWQNTYLDAPSALSTSRAADAGATGHSQRPVSQLPYSYRIVKHPTSAYYRAPDVPEDQPPAPGEALSTAVPMAASEGPVPAVATPAAPSGPDSIHLQTKSDSWVEVTDQSGERIYMDFMRGGESLTLTGHAPFSVVLGYALDMTIEFNGQAFDATPYMRAGVARFTLGQ